MTTEETVNKIISELRVLKDKYESEENIDGWIAIQESLNICYNYSEYYKHINCEFDNLMKKWESIFTTDQLKLT